MKEALIQTGWGIVEHLRRMVAPFLINMLFGIVMFASSSIELVAVQVVINAVCLLGCVAVTFFCMRSSGGNAWKMYEYGQVRRSEHREGASSATISGRYRTSKEYRPWKAVTISIAIVIIPAVLLLLGAFEIAWAQVVLVFLCGWAFFPEYVIYAAVTGTEEIIGASLYYGYIILALVMAAGIVGYLLGAAKERRRSEMLEMRTRKIEEQKRAREAAAQRRRQGTEDRGKEQK